MKMTWTNCFSSNRYGKKKHNHDARTEFERDWDRIVFSSPFRRLQNKTQVFALPDDIFVHNRLTHSLEVACVGRSLGTIIGNKLAALPEVLQDPNALHFYQHNLKNVIAAACLAHDLGNPAFGHAGEKAISLYFTKRDTNKKEDQDFKSQFGQEEWQDLINFEGNANALRILTMKLFGRANGGFRLTYSTLGAIIKYPCASSERDKAHLHRKKYGFFRIDQEVYKEIATELNMIKDKGDTIYKRHPFVYLVEAADDITYNIIDFEDAHRLGLLSYETVKKHFLKVIEVDPNNDLPAILQQLQELEQDPNESISYLRAKCISTLVGQCVEAFLQNKDKIIMGKMTQSLIDVNPNLQQAMKGIYQRSIEKIYNAKRVIELEIAGYRIMSSLVEDFVTAALTNPDDRTDEHIKVLSLISSQFAFDDSSTPYEKIMHTLDFISGMTDHYALQLYRKMRGIDI